MRLAERFGVRVDSRMRAITAISEAVPLREIRAAVAEQMTQRRCNKWEAGFWRRFDAEAGHEQS